MNKTYLKKSDEDKNMHAGHRARLMDLVHRVGLDNLTDIQIMEVILFYVFPRGDVNPLAHRLLNKFGDIPSVLEAPLEELVKVKGLNDTSAKKFINILEIHYVYTMRKMQKEKKLIAMTNAFYDYLEDLLRFRKEEELHIFGLNDKAEVIKSNVISKGTKAKVGIDLNGIIDYSRVNNLNIILIVHNHPNNTCAPSEGDLKSFEELDSWYSSTGFYTKDSLVVGVDGIYSSRKRKLVRIFDATIDISELNTQQSLQ